MTVLLTEPYTTGSSVIYVTKSRMNKTHISSTTEPRFSSLVDIKAGENGIVPSDIHILTAGSWKTVNHGSFDITEADLDEMVGNFNDGVRKGLPIDEEHNTTGGAVGWIEKLERRGKQLWASATWNTRGSNALADRQYRFFSPEFAPRYQDPETGAMSKNVLLGGGITNRPLFKNLKPIMASEDTSNILYLNEETLMDLEALRAKDDAELTAEERTFLAENKPAEEPVNTITPPPVEEPPAPVVAAESVTISASELAALREMKNQFSEMQRESQAAKEELRQKQCSEKVTSWEFNDKGGRFPALLHDDLTGFILSLNETQASAFEALVEKIPNKKVFGELGDSGEEAPQVAEPATKGAYSVKGSAYAELEKQASEIIKASDGKTSYGQALMKARKASPDLAAKADEENVPVKATRE